MEDAQKWFLMKHDDGTVFGPLTFEQLRLWALEAQVSPLDKVSTDEKTWIKAPMVPELEMDYLLEVSPDQYYGPTTIGAVREFLQIGEITPENVVTNCKDGSERLVRDIPELQAPAADDDQPVRTSIRLSLQQRIRELEEHLLEERRARDAAEHRCEKLEAKLSELSAKTY
ncbi:MAG: hypothetical protein QOD99_1153 [Chthoniobacter sp.]|jgi:peptidoglycan hydrolase-like protein with peptidoglycan-binding domain|nr:hypothetical protein [Chthoniobacter sp.]